MNIKRIKISKGQHLSDVYCIEPNTILCKTLTGLGATYSEIKAKRHSIIIEPNQPAIVGKYNAKVHKKDNLCKAMEGVTADQIADYLVETLNKGKYIKILSTPESFYKVKQAFDEVEENPYVTCFMLMDECQKFIQDNDYREDITLPIEDFFMFDEKAMVSATPILPSDPRFKEQGFSIVEIVPDYECRKEITIIPTNNVVEALKVTIPQIQQNQAEPRSICFFVNSTDMILQFMNILGIASQSAVFCSSKSVDKLKRNGFKNAYEHWDAKRKMPYMFFTSRFYTALDIELDEKPDIVFVTEPYFSEYTVIDPNTDVVQAIGRFRNGTSSHTHVVTTNSGFPIRTKEGIMEYVNASEIAYNTILTLYWNNTSVEYKSAYKAALDILPYNKLSKEGKRDYFATDNYIDTELVKSAYNNINSLTERYRSNKLLSINILTPLKYPISYGDRLKLGRKGQTTKEVRKRIVGMLDNLKESEDIQLVQSHIEELRKVDAFIVEAYETVGKEIIELNGYSYKKIKEAMILHNYRTKTTGVEFIQLLKNSFKVGSKYQLNYIKNELNRLYKLVGIVPKQAVTAQTIKEFFNVKECKVSKKRGFQLLEAKI